ncbi:NAD(P)-binding protein [Corynespora cassiicola Philippines]|uniref:NAD(P)-binding protein n=1 Tax=Corynespora cassiicola Philippines TaxID=1448308 RepID=A0A2T2PBU6_CORCC|nr:NAD(P)-binding protein [Corynespora cassiicola Philippines]
MSSINNVVLIGKGLLGSFVLPALVDAGFTVTLLGRSEKSKQGLPSGAKFQVVDYTSIDSLEAAFRGQDAVVSTVGMEGIMGQKLMIDAAIKAGVKRFIPSDFGSSTTNPDAARFWHHIPMVEIQKYIKEKAEAGSIEYTILSMGGFLEFVIQYDFLIDWKNKSVEIWGDGNAGFSATSLEGVGKAVAGILKNLEPTKNRNIFVHEVVLSQNKLLELAKKRSAPETKWNVTHVDDIEARLQNAEKAAVEKQDLPNTLALIKAAVLSGKFGAHYHQVDNDLVGLQLISDAELEAKVAQLYA